MKSMIYQSRNNIEGALMVVAPPYQLLYPGKLLYNGAISHGSRAAWVINQTTERKRTGNYHS